MRMDLMALVAGFVLCWLLTDALRRLAVRWAWYDLADGERKVHTRPIPRVGGIALAVSVAAVVAVAVSTSHRVWSEADVRWFMAMGTGGLCIVVAGVWDDVRGAPAWAKLLVQVGAAWAAARAGVVVDAVNLPFWGEVPLGGFALPVTVLGVVACTNAYNLIDGLDGLAGGLAALAAATLLAMGWASGAGAMTLGVAAMLGAVLGFLLHNRHPAAVFLGDTGSLLLGFLLALGAIEAVRVPVAPFAAPAVALVLAIPVIDLGIAVVRRALSGRALFAADQHHLHHLLLRRGWTQPQVLGAVAGGSAGLSVLALTAAFASDAVSALASITGVVCLAWAIRSVGYPEVVRAGRRARLLRAVVDASQVHDTALRIFRRDLSTVRTVDALWRRVEVAAAGLGLESVEFDVEPSIFGFSMPRRRTWTRATSAEQRGVHLAMERAAFPLDLGSRRLGVLRILYFRENQVFEPHERALHQGLADAIVQGLVRVVAEQSRLDNVLPFRPVFRDPATT